MEIFTFVVGIVISTLVIFVAAAFIDQGEE